MAKVRPNPGNLLLASSPSLSPGPSHLRTQPGLRVPGGVSPSFPASLCVPAERAGAVALWDSSSQPGGGILCLVPEVSRRSRHSGESAGSGERDSTAAGFGARNRESEYRHGRSTVPGTNLSCIWQGKKRNAGREKQDPCGQVAPIKIKISPLCSWKCFSYLWAIIFLKVVWAKHPVQGQGLQMKGNSPRILPTSGCLFLGTQQPQLVKMVCFPSLMSLKGNTSPWEGSWSRGQHRTKVLWGKILPHAVLQPPCPPQELGQVLLLGQAHKIHTQRH